VPRPLAVQAKRLFLPVRAALALVAPSLWWLVLRQAVLADLCLSRLVPAPLAAISRSRAVLVHPALLAMCLSLLARRRTARLVT
jgi:hypothetical protein